MLATMMIAAAAAAQTAPMAQTENSELTVTAENRDPATLLNHGAELLREGRVEEARSVYETVKKIRVDYTLETVDGRWVYPPYLAREALRTLDSRQSATQLATRD